MIPNYHPIDNIPNNPVVYLKNGVEIHMSCAVYSSKSRDILFPNESSWEKAIQRVEQWTNVKTNDKLIGYRFLVGEDYIKDHLADIHLCYILTYEGVDSWSRHISAFWADQDEQPYLIHINMFDKCESIFNGLWEGIEGSET